MYLFGSNKSLFLPVGLDESHQVEARINKEHSHYMDRWVI